MERALLRKLYDLYNSELHAGLFLTFLSISAWNYFKLILFPDISKQH